jgi:hypothetical protein
MEPTYHTLVDVASTSASRVVVLYITIFFWIRSGIVANWPLLS